MTPVRRPVVGCLLAAFLTQVCLALVVLAPLVGVVPEAGAAPDDDPATITVTTLEPRTVSPESVIIVTGTVTNTSDLPIRELVLRLQRGDVLTTRSGLADNDEDPSSSTAAFAPFVELASDLGAGNSVPFSYRTSAAELGLADSGVYPLLVNVNGTPDGDVEQRIGQLDTYLPFRSEPAAAPTGVAWLWPLVDRPHRAPDGTFTDDELADSVAGGGRLDRLLSLAEDAPEVRLTLAVDPLLLADLQAMVGSYQLADGSTGTGGSEAASWLDRLSMLAAQRPVLALPYADVDIDALTRAGMSAQVTDAVDRGRLVAEDILGTPPQTTLAWPMDGVLTEAALSVLLDAGSDTFVLSPAAVEQASGRRTPDAASEVLTSEGSVAALVGDQVLNDIVAAADGWPTGPRLAVQRYLAELAMISAEAPSVGRELLITPPRRWDARATYALPMLAATTGESWLSSVDLTELDRTDPVDRGQLTYPDEAAGRELAADGMSVLAAGAAAITDFASMLVVDTTDDEQIARDLVDPLDRAVLSAASSYWREDRTGLRRAADTAAAAVQARRRQVLLVVPADGAYSLASAEAPLVFTVDNQLPLPVQVRISVDATQVAGLSTDEVGTQVIAPARRSVIEVPATVERPGEFRVTAAIFTPAGNTLGEPVLVTVRSSVYGGLALIITSAAGGLLVLLIGLRLVRRIRAGRRETVASP